MIGVYNHLRNGRYSGSMKPFSVSVSQDPWEMCSNRFCMNNSWCKPGRIGSALDSHAIPACHDILTAASIKLDPKWVPERAKHSGRKIWHEMKGPWRLSPIEHNPKITNLFSRRAFLVTPRWWRSTWRFPITDHSWNVDIHARKSKRGRRANQVKSNNSRQISQVK